METQTIFLKLLVDQKNKQKKDKNPEPCHKNTGNRK